MARALTDISLKGIKPPAAGRSEVADLRCAGLTFRVTAAGVQSWSFRFRDPDKGTDARKTIGRYPDISLGEAREAADKLRRDVAMGVNPTEAARRNRSDANTKTFEALAIRYMDEHARRFKRSADADDRNLRLHVLPHWRSRRYDQIRRADVIELVERIVKAGSPVQANRVQALVSTIFSFAVDGSLVEVNPCTRLRKRGVENRETRVLSDDEIRQFWPRSVLPPVTRRVGLALRLAFLTACRTNEIAGINRDELFDIDVVGKASWLLPADRSKNGSPHFVPLSEPARMTIKSALELVSDDDEWLFPSPIESGGPITPHSLTTAMARMAGKIEGKAKTTWAADPPSPHDLRRTVATRLAQSGAPAEDIAAVLNHVRSDVTGRHYDHYRRAAEKRRALEAWGSELNNLLPDRGHG